MVDKHLYPFFKKRGIKQKRILNNSSEKKSGKKELIYYELRGIEKRIPHPRNTKMYEIAHQDLNRSVELPKSTAINTKDKAIQFSNQNQLHT
jgi:hypothetical protein